MNNQDHLENHTEKKKQELCLQCNECCKTIAMPAFLLGDPMTTDWLKFRGCEFFQTNFGMFVLIPSICPYLTDKGCAVYERRPEVCRNYDGRQIPFMVDKCKWNELEVVDG